MLGPIAVAVLWMGVYPESFLAPMRADIAALDARASRAKPEGDARLVVGEPAPTFMSREEAEAAAAAEPAPPPPTLDPPAPAPTTVTPAAAPEGSH